MYPPVYPAYTVPVRIPASVTPGLPSDIIDARRHCCKHKLALSPPVLHFLPETDTGCTNLGKGARNQSSPSRGAQGPEATTLSCSFSRTEMIVALIRQIRSAQPPAAVLWQAVFFPRYVQLASAANLPREISCLHGTGQGSPCPFAIPSAKGQRQISDAFRTGGPKKQGCRPLFPSMSTKRPHLWSTGAAFLFAVAAMHDGLRLLSSRQCLSPSSPRGRQRPFQPQGLSPG